MFFKVCASTDWPLNTGMMMLFFIALLFISQPLGDDKPTDFFSMSRATNSPSCATCAKLTLFGHMLKYFARFLFCSCHAAEGAQCKTCKSKTDRRKRPTGSMEHGSRQQDNCPLGSAKPGSPHLICRNLSRQHNTLAMQERPFCKVKVPVLKGKSAYFETQKWPFCKAIYNYLEIKHLRSTI